MTLSLALPRPGKFAVLAATLLGTGALFSAASLAPAAQAAGSAYYAATLTAPAAESRAVAGGVAWACQGTTCVANKGDGRPLRICRGLNRKFGEIATFRANGEELAAEELAKCNAA